VGRPASERDPRRSLLIGVAIATVVLLVVFAVVVVGVISVFSARQGSRSVGRADASSVGSVVGDPIVRDGRV
jgi:uncharacterized DUF497 family protein